MKIPAWWYLMLFVGSVASAPVCFAQGGPPMITDDPGTPGNRRWEINLGFIEESRNGETNLQTPDFDFNYGAGDRVQLNFEIPIVVRSAGATESGLGNSKVGVKWRFLGETQSGLAVSTYPHVVFNNPTSSVRRGLADDGWQVFLPIEASQRLGKFQLNAEAGYNIQQRLANEIWLGLVAGYDATKRVQLLGELHSIGTRRFSEHESVFDLGGRVKLTSLYTFLFTAGRAVPGTSNDQPDFFVYTGVQFTF